MTQPFSIYFDQGEIMGRKSICDDPQNPKLLGVIEALSRDPSLPKSHFYRHHGIGQATLTAWENAGWVKFQKASQRHGFRVGSRKPKQIGCN